MYHVIQTGSQNPRVVINKLRQKCQYFIEKITTWMWKKSKNPIISWWNLSLISNLDLFLSGTALLESHLYWNISQRESLQMNVTRQWVLIFMPVSSKWNKVSEWSYNYGTQQDKSDFGKVFQCKIYKHHGEMMKVAVLWI